MISYQTKIVKRFMDEKGIREFEQLYKEHCIRTKFIKKPNEKDARIAHMIRKEKNYSTVAKSLGIPVSQVHSAVGRYYAYSN